MPKFLTASRLKAAIEALSDTGAKPALIDFLTVKRALAIKGASPVKTSLKEPAFLKATCELASIHNVLRYGPTEEKAYFIPFGFKAEMRRGFRKGNWPSNGTANTITNAPWAKVFSLTNDKPRAAALALGYEAHLTDPDLLLKEVAHKPSLSEFACWTYRHTDLEPILGSESDPIKRGKQLQEKLIKDLDLTSGEISVLFVTSDLVIDDQDIAPTPADPIDYVPGLASTSAAIGGDCSLDLVAALAAKPFVILSGASGTGKSRSTLRLAEAIQSQYADTLGGQIFKLVPIGPDWTSPKKLLGYRTPFGRARQTQDGKETNESYEITETLRLILRACHTDSTKVPHFLVFDEMNLSHVERYFAPFLSLMEASSILDKGEPIVDPQSLSVISEILDLEDKNSREAQSARHFVKSGKPLTLPPNLFYVGTVNVDETTYMFSPKVLDRAHVLEVQALTPSQYMNGNASNSRIDLAHANELLLGAIDDREGQASSGADPTAAVDVLAAKHGIAPDKLQDAKALTLKTLDGCFHLLKPTGFEFGYRVVKEVYGYLNVWVKAQITMGATPTDAMNLWSSGLDRALFQKVLPKIHGNRSVLGDSLWALAAFLDGYDADSDCAAKFTLGIDEEIRIEPADALNIDPDTFPISTAKLRSMHSRLISRNYTSFIR